MIYFVSGATSFGSDFQSFLAGSPLLGEGGGGLGNHDYRIPGYAWFAQDDVRASKTLTLNLGFRNEFLGAPYDTLCHTGNTNPDLAITTGQPYVYPKCIDKFGLSGISGTLNQAGLNNEYATVWEPRIGFAYDVAGRHTTSIRGGYGIYSVREDLGAVDNLAIVPPTYPFLVGFLPGPGSLANLFAASAAFPNGIPQLGANPTQTYVPTAAILQGVSPTCTLGNTAPGVGTDCGPAFSGNVNGLIQLAVPLHWVVGTTQQWNFTIQQQIGNDWFAELGYVGTKGDGGESGCGSRTGVHKLNGAGAILHNHGYNRGECLDARALYWHRAWGFRRLCAQLRFHLQRVTGDAGPSHGERALFPKRLYLFQVD